MDNLLSYCVLVDARISATEKDLPVWMYEMWLRKSRMKRNKKSHNESFFQFVYLSYASYERSPMKFSEFLEEMPQ